MNYFEDIIVPAMKKFYKNDKILIEHGVHEQAISHHVAKYIESIKNKYILLKKLSIDCEYNKTIDGEKRLPGDSRGNRRPDIILHNRNSKSENTFVIEIKKEKSKYDRNKLRKIVKKFDYKIGYAIQNITLNGFVVYFYPKDERRYMGIEKEYEVKKNGNIILKNRK